MHFFLLEVTHWTCDRRVSSSIFTCGYTIPVHVCVKNVSLSPVYVNMIRIF